MNQLQTQIHPSLCKLIDPNSKSKPKASKIKQNFKLPSKSLTINLDLAFNPLISSFRSNPPSHGSPGCHSLMSDVSGKVSRSVRACKESWGDSGEDDDSDDVSDDDDGNNDDSDNDDGDNDSNSEKTESDDDKNPNLNLKNDEEQEYEEEYVHTSEKHESTDDETNMWMRKRKGDEEKTDADHNDVTQETTYEQVKGDEHVTLTTAHEHRDLYDALVKYYKLVRTSLNLMEYLFDLSKPLSLIEDRGRQVVPVNYFINNDLEYLKGRSSSRKYTTSTIKTKAAKYDEIQGIEDMVPSLWSPVKMFTRRVVILKRVKDLQLRVETYQKKLNITRPETFRTDISKRTPYTAHNNPQGIIYVDKFKRNRLIRLDELYKFSNGTLTPVNSVLHDIASNLRMDYLPKRKCSNLDKQRSRIMIKAIYKLQLERRLMRNLEKFVGGREKGKDFRLLEQTI
uniref:Uncharacterized protein n=1 Tax=Tanacetum cinerariifolium TaxID=118510 RepID=A0A699HAJ1_TANCI|nr:hypothetical protein [Tanacetum cinerariifolium]